MVLGMDTCYALQGGPGKENVTIGSLANVPLSLPLCSASMMAAHKLQLAQCSGCIAVSRLKAIAQFEVLLAILIAFKGSGCLG